MSDKSLIVGRCGSGSLTSARLLADDAIPLAVSHVPIRGMRTRHRGYPVPARLLAGNPPVPIVVVARERIVTGAGIALGSAHRGGRHRAHNRLKRRTLAAREDTLERRRLAPVGGGSAFSTARV